jgi:hypothetical protein
MDGEAAGAPAVRRVSLETTGAHDKWHQMGHLHFIEPLLEPILGPTPLSAEAVFCDAIPWKWGNSRKSEEKHKQPQLSIEEWKTVWRVQANRHVSRIAEVLDPQLVLVMDELNKWLPAP